MRKWFNGLKSEHRMLVRVTLSFAAALSFWFFYYNAIFEGEGPRGNFRYLAVSVTAFLLFVYLETGRKK